MPCVRVEGKTDLALQRGVERVCSCDNESRFTRDRHRTRPGRLGGRTDGQPSRPVAELWVLSVPRPVAGRW
jgi:hypothetical protein